VGLEHDRRLEIWNYQDVYESPSHTVGLEQLAHVPAYIHISVVGIAIPHGGLGTVIVRL